MCELEVILQYFNLYFKGRKIKGEMSLFFFAFKIFIDMCTGLFLRRKINV